MKIRSITYFCNPGYPLAPAILQRAGKFLRGAEAAFQSAGYEVQTKRLATTPFPRLLGERRLKDLPGLAQELDLLIQQIGVGYASLGPALPEMPRSYDVIPDAIANAENVFLSGVMADKRGGIDLAAVRLCAQVIKRCAPFDPNGFANLRFAALANVAPGSPFFPAAYHGGGQPAFAIATEAADLAVDAFEGAATVDEGRGVLVSSIEKHGKALAKVAASLIPRDTKSPSIRQTAPRFLGIDFSLAPFPSEALSLGTAFERLGVSRVGMHGSLAAAAILTEAIDRARFPRAGFSGLFLPVMEDATLAQRAAQGMLTVKDLLLYSAVCGTGLDTLPLPGDTSAEQIGALLLDLSALALRLDKPLTARLMPIPNKKAGDPTGFDFEFFANSKVMALSSEGLHGPLGGGDAFALKSR
jgi:uncharacterized protein (UPF0210 family)